MEAHDEGIPKDLPSISKTVLIVLALLVVALFVGMFLYGYLPHRAQEKKLDEAANERAESPPTVEVTTAKPEVNTTDLVVPGNAFSWQETAIYARVNGYLKQWLVDIGDTVKKGQTLAWIEAPDTDAQLNQAQAALEQAKANVVSAKTNYELARATFERYNGLVSSGSVTQQQLDQVKTTAATAEAANVAAEAAVRVAEANVQRLQAEKGFEQITAPFNGVITSRNYDVGALILANNSAPGQEMFRIADTETLRIFVRVPQPYVTMLHDGQEGYFTVRNYPGQKFVAHLARTAGAIDQSSRTLLTQLNYDNHDGKLYAGMYGQVEFQLQREKPPLILPTSALMFEANGMQVALVRDGKIHFQHVTLGRDYGTEVEVLTGLNGADQVVTNPGEKLAENVQVQATPAPQSVAQPARAAESQPSQQSPARPDGERVAQGDSQPVNSQPGDPPPGDPSRADPPAAQGERK